MKDIEEKSEQLDLKAKDMPSLNKLNWWDPFLMEEDLREDEKILKDSVRNFVIIFCIKKLKRLIMTNL